MNDFKCPRCNGHIRIGEQIIFKVRNPSKQTTLLLLSPQIGNYSSIKHPDFELRKGEVIEFFCPLCDATLTSDIHKNLAYVIMIDEAGKSYDVYFSQIAGEHCTYETDGDSVHAAGEDAGRYTYFKLGNKFKKYF
jgi:hypothetical protein